MREGENDVRTVIRVELKAADARGEGDVWAVIRVKLQAVDARGERRSRRHPTGAARCLWRR